MITTKIKKIELKEILDNYLDKEYWEKKWCIFKNNRVMIEMNLSIIYTYNNLISIKVLVYVDNVNRYNTFCIPINNNEFTEIHFKNKLYGEIIRTLEIIEECFFIPKTSFYKEAKELEEIHKENLKNIADDFLDENNVSNDVIREAYIEKYVEDNEIYYTDDIIEKMKYTILRDIYVAIGIYFDKDYDELCKKCEMDKEDFDLILNEIEEMKIKIDEDNDEEYEEYIEEYKDNLEEI